MTTVIQLDRISKRFIIEHDKPRSFQEMMVTAFRRNTTREEYWALHDVSLSIEQGQTVGIVGVNGSGKSTILKLIARIIHPTSGQVRINGRTAALLELGAGFHPDLSGRENILLNGLLLGMSRREIRERLDQIVAFAELERFIDSPLRHYSSGMYMRLAFSVAIHVDPDILLIDEILAVGDEDFQQKCFGRIHKLQNAGKTVLVVSHSTTTLRKLCHSLVLLNDGNIAAQGDPTTVIHAYHELLRAHDPAFHPTEAPAPSPDQGAPDSVSEPVGTDTREEPPLISESRANADPPVRSG
ncbi:MAG: ABC transporter ATP-binding protein [Chloroflexota bacterium]|nr:MAG: ABC transporter ATP-binding protein [Chloroflexota bacterium]